MGCRIRCFVEPSPAGTAGALTQAQEYLAEQFLLLNGDSLFAINYLDLCVPALGSPAPVGVVALRHMARSRLRPRRAEWRDDHRFRGKGGDSGPGLINGGIYWFRRAVLDWIEAVPASLEQDVLPRLATAGLLAGRCYDGFFIDIGIPKTCRARRR